MPSLESLIRAALIWDVPTLRGSGHPGATAFLESLSAAGYRTSGTGNDPLSRAASVIARERTGDPTADLVLAELRASDDKGAKLLGLCLQWWCSAELPAGLQVLTDSLVAEIRPGIFRSRIFTKLSAHAYERGDFGAFVSFLGDARAAAPRGTALERALEIVAVNHGLERLNYTTLAKARPRSDPLVDLNWIDDAALSAARAQLDQLIATRSESPWSWTFRSGPGPLDEAVAAELQIGWAGALWKRDRARRQAGAQALLGGPTTSLDGQYGVGMWILGGGQQIGNILRLAEPAFGEDSADTLVELLRLNSEEDPRRRRQLTEFCASGWDLLSDAATTRLLDIIRFDESAPHDAALTFWSQAALRVPHEWARRMQALSGQQKVRMLGALSPSALLGLGRSDAADLCRAYEQARDASDSGPEAQAAYIALRAHSDERPWCSPIPLRLVGEVLERNPKALSNSLLETAESELIASFRREVEEGKQGTGSLGGRSAPLALAQVADARGRAHPTLRQALLEVARDLETPGNLRLSALDALARLGVSNLLTQSDLRSLRAPIASGRPSIFAEVSAEVLRAAQLLARATVLTDLELAALVPLVRDKDPRVRELSANAAAVAHGRNGSGAAQEVLLAALFDPEERVVRTALGGVGRARGWPAARRQALVARLGSLFDDYGRLTRARCVAATRELRGARRHPILEEIQEKGRRDRSWIVRREAQAT